MKAVNRKRDDDTNRANGGNDAGESETTLMSLEPFRSSICQDIDRPLRLECRDCHHHTSEAEKRQVEWRLDHSGFSTGLYFTSLRIFSFQRVPSACVVKFASYLFERQLLGPAERRCNDGNVGEAHLNERPELHRGSCSLGGIRPTVSDNDCERRCLRQC